MGNITSGLSENTSASSSSSPNMNSSETQEQPSSEHTDNVILTSADNMEETSSVENHHSVIKRSSINLTLSAGGSSNTQHETFKQELEKKHEKRRQLIAEKRKEMLTIREELEKYKKENYDLKNNTNKELEDYKQENEELRFKLNNSTDKNVLELSAELEKYKLENENLNKSMRELEKVKKENEELKEEVSTFKDLKEENEDLKLQVKKLRLELKSNEEIVSKNKELRISLAEMQGEVQNLNIDLLNIEQERLEYAKHIGALKDVVRVTKEMLSIRESQIEELKGKIKTVEELLASKEMKIMSDGLREEYERQLRNIRNLRALYEERQRLDKKDKENLQEQLDETKKQVEDEQKKNSELQERVIELEKDTSMKYDTITSLQSNLGLSKAECKELQAEINIINQLFSEILLGFKNTQEIDLDKLIKLLEENHDLLTNMATNEESNSTSAALPKLLLDLINQMNKEDEAMSFENSETPNQASNQLNSAEEIVETLPKVWKVLMELLSHQNPPLNALFGQSQEEPCYKLIETSKGAKLKLSVSQTFIRLKDLILEKKFLERETYRLKHLNTHLECRLQDQEKRLELVSGEVKNTWHVVDKMQRQHQQLHTHEKVLRYELQQKRQLLNELKEDLQYCREKWVEARAKNDTTHSQWKELRKEFADRKNKSADDYNQSAESGYSDGKDSSEDERGYESDVSEGKHETDVETDGDKKTESVQINEKRQIVQNDGSSTNSLDNTNGDISAEVASGGEIELSTINALVTSNNYNEEAQSEDVELRPTRNSHIEAGTKRLENLLEAREIRLKKMEEFGSQLVSRVIGRDGNSNINADNNGNVLEEATSSHEVISIESHNDNEIVTTNKIDEDKDLLSRVITEEVELNQEQLISSDQLVESMEDEINRIETSDNSLTQEQLISSEQSDEKIVSSNEEITSISDSPAKTDIVEASLILDREVQELFDEMCKFVEEGTTEAKLEGTDGTLSDREERLHRLEEEFKEVTEVDVKEAQVIDEGCDLNKDENLNDSVEETLPCLAIHTNTDVEVMVGVNDENADVACEIKQEDKIYTNTLILNNPPLRNDDINKMPPRRSTEEILLRREERLKRLEAQSQLLLAKTRKTTQKSNVICEKLDELHGMYGESSSQEIKAENDTQDDVMMKAKNSRKLREEILMRREARLRKLDMQCKALLAKILKRTENKSCEEENEAMMVVEQKVTHVENKDGSNNSNSITVDNQIDSVNTLEHQNLEVEGLTELSCDKQLRKTDDESNIVTKTSGCLNNDVELPISMLKLTNEENLLKLEENCRGLLTEVRNKVSTRRENIISELTTLLPKLIQSVEDEIHALMILYTSFEDGEMLDEASAVCPAAISEALLDSREARYWKLGEQCWEIVNTVDEF